MTIRWHRFMWVAAAMAAACCAPAAGAEGSASPSAATWHAYQRSYHFQQLDGRNGLAQNSVSLVAQDRKGFMWFATQGGLFRYDGYRLTRYTHDPDRADSLPDDYRVQAMADAGAGRWWIGPARGGLTLFDPATDRTIALPAAVQREGTPVTSLLELPGGDVLVGSPRGVDVLTGGAARPSLAPVWVDANGAQSPVRAVARCDDGATYAAAGEAVIALDPAHRRGRVLATTSRPVNVLLCNRKGELLVGGAEGLDRVDRQSGAASPLLAQATRAGVVAITADLAGRLWFALGDHSLLRLGPDGSTLRLAPAPLGISGGLPDSPIETLFVDRTGLLWIGSLTSGVAWTHPEGGQAVLRDGSLGNAASLRFAIPTVWWWRLPMLIVYAIALALLILIAVLGWRGHHLEQVRHRRQLLLRENRLRQALWGSGDEFWDWNLERGTILRLGPEGAPGGHHEEAIAADQWRANMVHPDDLANLDRAMAEHIAGHTEHFEVEHRVRGRDGEWIWVISRGRIVERDASGKPLRMCGTERDISAIRAAERDRRIASEVIRSMSEAVAVTDLDYRFVSINTAFTRMTGYADNEVLGRDASVLNGSRHAPASYTQLRQTLAETGHWRGELWQRRKDGEEFLCWMELNEVCDTSGQRTHMIAVLTDITDRKRAEQELRYLANYDTLTGLPNRALLGERLGAAVISARRSGEKVGLLFLDLDRFKHINDSLGHSTGDRTLKAAGARLRQCVRETDVVARLGGDEFTVVLENLANVRGAEDMARRLIHAFERPLPITATQETVISPSIGIALYPDHGQTPADLLKCADTAMYQAKERGRNTWAVYHAGMDARARDHATLVTALRRALERGELSMVYQPKLAIRGSERITGMEALLRWHSRDLGEVKPTVFIPIAEETGQIHDISAFVFANACADLRRFREAGHPNLSMAINLSATQLNRPDLTLQICDLLAEHDVAPDHIELELTESMVMANPEQSVRLLGELKSIGTHLAIDDFGTGYSSLAYLKRLPIDTLKIDQEFVGDVTTDPDDAAITATIITMAHSLQLNVVAEGVETTEQLAFLRAQQCDQIQGYLVSHPLTAEACLDFLDRCAPASAKLA